MEDEQESEIKVSRDCHCLKIGSTNEYNSSVIISKYFKKHLIVREFPQQNVGAPIVSKKENANSHLKKNQTDTGDFKQSEPHSNSHQKNENILSACILKIVFLFKHFFHSTIGKIWKVEIMGKTSMKTRD